MISRDDLVLSFDRWVLDPGRGPDLDIPVHVGRHGTATDRWAVVDVLYELADEPSLVDGRVAAALSLPAGATYGLAARLLWATQSVWGTRVASRATSRRMAEVSEPVPG